MVHWIRLPIALSPDKPYDSDGLSTGSTTIIDGIPTIMYSGRVNDSTDVQCQARPSNLSDPTLINWTKSIYNPLILKPNGRDPSTAFQDDKNNYYLIYGYGTPDLGGQAVLFTSKDFLNWTYLHPLHSNKYDNFWECPDIFNVSNRLILKASLLQHDFWTIGILDWEKLTFSPLNHDIGEYIQLIDHGRFYASKTFYDPINDQQIIMGWIPEEDNLGVQRGWQGCHSLPRSIFLSEDNLQIRSRPIDQLKTLRHLQSHKHLENIILSNETTFDIIDQIQGNQIELQTNWQFPMNESFDFGLSVLSTIDGLQRTDIGIFSKNNINLMIGWNLPKWDYLNLSNLTQWSQCASICNNDFKCSSWTFIQYEQNNQTCFLKTGIPFPISSSNSISGIKPKDTTNQHLVWIYINRTLSQINPYSSHSLYHAPLWLQSTNENNQWFIQLNIFIDHSIIEIFEPQAGRFAITARVYPEDSDANHFALYVRKFTANIILNAIDAWNLTTIWT